MSDLNLSIEQSECTGCTLCPDISSEHFYIGEDGLAYVKNADEAEPSSPANEGFLGTVAVAEGLEDDVIEAADCCPGACIYVVPNTVEVELI